MQGLPDETRPDAMARRTSAAKAVPVQDRALRTRAALLDTVEETVAAEGVAAVTTTAIAERAGVSVGTLYRYFADRDSLLLAAYDATVRRIVATCAETLGDLPAGIPADEAACRLLTAYLDAAEEIPSHAGLLKAMRAIRTIEADQSRSHDVSVIGDLFAPFLDKYAPGHLADPSRLQFMYVLVGNLIDLYLVTPGTPVARAAMRREIEAHMLLALERMVAPREGA